MSTSFISKNAQGIVTLNGSAMDAELSVIHGKSAVQLRRVSAEESGFNWSGVREIIAKEIFIYDEMDLKCLTMFITSNIRMDLSGSYVSPDTFDALIDSLNTLIGRGIQVTPGSTITISKLGSEMGKSDVVVESCKRVGFRTLLG